MKITNVNADEMTFLCLTSVSHCRTIFYAFNSRCRKNFWSTLQHCTGKNRDRKHFNNCGQHSLTKLKGIIWNSKVYTRFVGNKYGKNEVRGLDIVIVV